MDESSAEVLAGPLGQPVWLRTVAPGSPRGMKRQLGQPLEQSGGSVGQFVSLGCSQPSPQQRCGPPAGLEPAAGGVC